MSAAIAVPHALLRFVRQDEAIYFMDAPVYDGLVCQRIDLELPIIRVEGVHAGRDGVRVGYRFHCPRELTTVRPNWLIVARSGQGENKWESLIGLPGLQVFISSIGISILSTRITRFYRSLE